MEERNKRILYIWKTKSMARFVDIVEDVTSLKVEEMEEIRDIISKILIEKRTEEILKHRTETEQLYKEGKLKFYDNSSDALNEDD